MKAFKTTSVSLGTSAAIFFGFALILIGCQTSPSAVNQTHSSPSLSPEVVKPTVKVETQSSPVATPTQTPSPEAAQPVPQETPTPAPDTSGFVAGTCKELRAKGLSDFRPGDPNYTSSRDRDKDGVACES